MAWTEERIDLLKKLWSEGKSGNQIATALGGAVSRNAVIGKIHRLGLSGRSTKWNKEAYRTHTSRRINPRPAPPNKPIRKIKQPDQSANVTLFDRQRNQCSWIEGETNGAETVCCGLPVESGAPMQFCPFHIHAAARSGRTEAEKQADEARSRRQKANFARCRELAAAKSEFFGGAE